MYCRVSSDKQANFLKGHTSLETQQEKIYKYAEENNFNIEHCYYDICSARNIENQYYLKLLLDNCHSGDTIIFYDISRFSRNTADALNLLNILSKKNIQVYSLLENIKYNSIFEKNMFRMQLCKSENESDLISIRVKNSISYRRSKGHKIGNPPYGFKAYKNSMGIRKFRKFPKEQMIINLIKKLINDNNNFTNIANLLNNKNLLKRNKKWNNRNISKLLKNEQQKMFNMNKMTEQLNKI